MTELAKTCPVCEWAESDCSCKAAAQPEHDAEVEDQVEELVFEASNAIRTTHWIWIEHHVRRCAQAARLLGKREKLAECGTCGCTGVMTVDDWSKGYESSVEEVCDECAGTGIGDMGKMLADAKAEGARSAWEAALGVAVGGGLDFVPETREEAIEQATLRDLVVRMERARGDK